MEKSKLVTAFIFILSSIGFCQFSLAQEITNNTIGNRVETPKIIPPSPEAASLGKFGNVPVSLFTGVPNVSIPLFEITTKEISIPISISYHSSGLKVDEVSSNVGLGWTLIGGGVVSATIIGHPDFTAYGYVRPNERINDNHNPDFYTNPVDYDLFKRIVKGELDSEPDIYNYNFPGYSGKFVLDQDGNVNLIPNDKKLKITISEQFGAEITDPSGIKYIFNRSEFVSHSRDNVNCPEPVTSAGNPVNYSSSWYLSKIVLTNGDEVIFNYELRPYTVLNNDTEVHYQPYPNNNYCATFYPNPRKCKSQTNYGGARLISISYKTTLVQFEYDNLERLDLTGANRLKAVKIYNETALIRHFELYQNYFLASGVPEPSLPNLEKNLYYRLRLDSIKEVGKPAYKFNYHSSSNYPFPKRLSYSQDFWGYYNGYSNNELIPQINSTELGSLSGANREVNQYAVPIGILSSIQYPTGGSTVLEYEPNLYYGTKTETFSTQNGRAVYPGSNPEVLPGGITRDSFEVTGLTKNIIIRYSSSTTNSGGIINSVGLSMTGPNGYQAFFVGNSPSQGLEIENLLPGWYYISCIQYESEAWGYLGVYWREVVTQTLVQNWSGPGVRIATIKDQPLLGNQVVKKFSYNYPDNQLHSSGKITALPSYGITQYFPRINTVSNGGGANPTHYIDFTNPCKYYVRYSTSQVPLASIQGADVGYEYVTEEIISGNNSIGKTVSHFLMTQDLGGSINSYPFTPPTSNDWLRGQLLEKVNYKKTANGYIPVSKTINKYKIHNNPESFYDYKINPHPNEKNILGIKVSTHFNEMTNGGSYMPYIFAYDYFKYVSAWCHPESTTERLYSENGTDSTETVTKFYFNNEWFQLSKTEVSDSKNLLLTTEKKYPFNYAGTAVYDVMISKNIITPVIETKQYRNNDLLTTTLNSYSLWGTTQLALPQKIQTATRNNPLQTELEFKSYNINGKPLQFVGKDGIINSFIWDYSGRLPIAKCTGASTEDVAFTSFEADGNGGLGFDYQRITLLQGAITGKKAYDLRGSVWKNDLNPALTYRVSFWAKGTKPKIEKGTNSVFTDITTQLHLVQIKNGWELYSGNISGMQQLLVGYAGTGPISYIDEFRIYPANSNLISYTYLPDVGTSSECDANNHIIYYDYDFNGRLTLVRDYDQNIIRKICYTYNGQPGDCNTQVFYSTAISGSFQKNNCNSSTLVGSYVSVNIPTGQFTSVASQADADLQAMQYVQWYANQYGSCIPYCSASVCEQEEGYKCVNNICEQGITVITDCYDIGFGTYFVTYHYEWSDGSWSSNYYKSSPGCY